MPVSRGAIPCSIFATQAGLYSLYAGQVVIVDSLTREDAEHLLTAYRSRRETPVHKRKAPAVAGQGP